MDYREVKELIGIIDASGLTEFQLTMDNVSVAMSKLERAGAVSDTFSKKDARNALKESMPAGAQPLAMMIQDTPKEGTAASNEAVENAGEIVKAPIVGTFYASSGTGKEDFVSIGSKVAAGDTLCILEAMKIMNEIVSPCDGQVVGIYAQNEALVEYGQPLFRILP